MNPLIIVLTFFLAGSVQSQTLRTSITVEADKSIGQVKPFWKDFAQGGESSDPDYLAPLIPWMKTLNPRLVRTDGTFNHFTSARVDASGKLVTDFSALDKWIGHVHAMGAKPLLCISYNPKGLYPADNHNPLSDLELWEELVYRLVKHVNVDRKYGVEYWEVWNEPNMPQFWASTTNEYLRLYAVTVKAALRADPGIKIGGPAAAGSDSVWVSSLIDYAYQHNIPLDFVSWHDYRVPPQYYKQMARRTRGMLDDRGMNAELLITEWNYHAGMHPGNDNEIGAAYAANSLHQMLDSPLSYSQFFEPKDGHDWEAGRPYWGRWGMFNFHNNPKAVYYTFMAFSQLGSDRVKLFGGTTAVNGVAARDGSDLCIILYSCSSNEAIVGVDGTAAVNLIISGLPSGNITWERFLIDENHSNPVRQGHNSQFQKVAGLTTSTRDGVLDTCVWLEKDSVSLIRVSPAAPDAPSKPLPGPVSVPKPVLEPSVSCTRIYSAPVIDGDLSDWVAPEIGVESEHCSARIRFAWDNDALYAAIVVKESEFYQQQTGSQLWAGDSIQIGFDTLANALEGEAYGGDDYEYGLTLTPKGSLAWRYECPAWKRAGSVEEIRLVVKRDDAHGTSTYETAIPWSELDPFCPIKGSMLGVSLLINDVAPDGERRTLEWGGGIVGEKSPHSFNLMGLLDSRVRDRRAVE